MITEGEAAILLETTQRAFRNQSQSKQRSTLTKMETVNFGSFNGFCALFENESVNNHPNV